MLSQIKTLPRKLLLLVAASFLIGALTAFWVRFVLVDQKQVHYHANFAMYVNGEQDEFSNFTFYEEVASCSSDHGIDPKSRVHLHQPENSVVHVHTDGATWGHFFSNLGYTLGNKVVATDKGVFSDGQDGILHFHLNGESVDSIANRVIGNEDTLLIDFGNDSDEVKKSRYNDIENKAKVHNQEDDPATCSGDEAESFRQRLKRTLGIN